MCVVLSVLFDKINFCAWGGLIFYYVANKKSACIFRRILVTI